MKNELEMLTKSGKPEREDCTYDGYIKGTLNDKCLVPHVECNGCMLDGRFITEANKRLQELIPIILLEDS